ncbi:PKD-like family lipoprotein [Maribellus sediminis]|uniref:PKD-like family lipoprotein n=1 Tax=Maribellus sediminis TaxID=2696285 RepID=UPI0014309360|nr:PKD-like family lipoprotein [Maribellus sediminis]
MKKLIYLLLPILFLLPSCYEDLGNYDYDDAEVISVEGIASSYSKVSTIDRLVIDPQVGSTDPDARFEYFWGIYEANTSGYFPTFDTLTHNKELDYLVVQDAGNWELVFGAKNLNTGLTKLISSELTVTTEFTRGWYVLKDDGENSDIDQFLTPDTIIPSQVAENVFSAINGRKLQGKAKQFAFLNNYRTFVHNSSIATYTRTLFALSENDMSAIYIDNFKQIRGFNEIFFQSPAVRDLGVLTVGASTISDYIINDGKLHYLYTMTANSGIFGAGVLKNENAEDYHLSQYTVGTFSQLLFYDELSCTFLTHPTAGTTMLKVKMNGNSQMPAENINKELLFMSERNRSSSVALFRDRTDPNLMILSSISGSESNLNVQNDTIASGEMLQKAGIVTANKDEAMIYFSVNSEVWSRNLANGNEQKQFSFPAGEEISFIRHLKYTPSSDPSFNFNYVVVATTTGDGYKIYCFQKSSGNLAAEPDFTMEGSGKVGAVLYISPKVGYNTYSYGY